MSHGDKQDAPHSLSQKLISSGLAAGLAAYFMWGLFPVYFKATQIVSPLEILSHRVVWAVPFVAIIILLRKQGASVLAIFKRPQTFFLFILSAILIAINWGVYVWAIQIGEIFQASLGYYINPLLNVVIGIFLFNERLNRWQFTAVGLAALGVLILTIYGGAFPFIAICLALTFGFYGVIRKKVEAGALPGLFAETMILFPLAGAYMLWLFMSGELKFLQAGDMNLNALLLLAGPLTVTPLFFFAVAARRMPFSTLGFLQYIAPTLQFICGLYYGEAFTLAHALCFGCIWLAVAVFSYGSWKKNKPFKPL